MAVGDSILKLLQSLGGAAQGVDEAIFPSEDIRSGQANVTGAEMIQARKPDYEPRGVLNILSKVGQQGARRRVMEEELRRGRAKEEADIGLKKAQAGYYEAGSGLRGAQAEREMARIDIDRRLTDLKAQANEIAASKNDVQKEANYQKFQYMMKYAQSSVDRAQAAMMKAQSDDERQMWEEKWRMGQLEVDRLKAEAEAAYKRAMGGAAQSNAATNAAKIPIMEKNADTQARDVDSKVEWRASGQAGSESLENMIPLETENGTIRLSVDELVKVMKTPAIRKALGIQTEPGTMEKVMGAVTGTPPPEPTKATGVEQVPTRISKRSTTSAKTAAKISAEAKVKVRVKKPFGPYKTGQQIEVLDNDTLQRFIDQKFVERLDATAPSGSQPVR